LVLNRLKLDLLPDLFVHYRTVMFYKGGDIILVVAILEEGERESSTSVVFDGLI
jgi:hypothetical protein